MESLGDILKRLTPSGTSRSTSNGAEAYQEPEEPGEVCPVCQGLGWVQRRVPLGHPDFGEVFQCRCQRQEADRSRLERLQHYSGLPDDMLQRMTFNAFDPAGSGADAQGRATLKAAFTAASTFASSPEGWLLLTGTHGSGKTHLAVSVAAERIEHGEVVFFAFVPDLLDHLRATFNPNSPVEYDQLFEQVKSVPLLVLDDLGAESSTAWAQEKLYQIVVHRHNARLPTVITTYLTMEEIEEAHPRLASRLKDATVVHWVPISAPDYRDPQRRQPTQTRRPRR